MVSRAQYLLLFWALASENGLSNTRYVPFNHSAPSSGAAFSASLRKMRDEKFILAFAILNIPFGR